LPKTKEAVVERMAGVRALTLPGEEGCEVSDGLWSPDPAMPELEFNFFCVRGKRRAGRRGV
jgi:hypothetical protein